MKIIHIIILFLLSNYDTVFMLKSITVSKDNTFVLNSDKKRVFPNKTYKIIFKCVGMRGDPYSSYFSIFTLDSEGNEIKRFVKWINDFSENQKDYVLIFKTPDLTENIIIGYRINTETPVRSNVEINYEGFDSIRFEEVDETTENYDDIAKYDVPEFPLLNSKEENRIEEKIVWIFASPRSGTTWLGNRLLLHPENYIWFEPYIGFHLGLVEAYKGINDVNPKIDRIYDKQSITGHYFFSPHHKKNWIPSLRKLILNRSFSQSQSFKKNIIIKEPVGSNGADILCQTLPKSKMIFLLRDGRDVLDSRIDMHTKGSWANLKLLDTPELRKNHIKYYSVLWNLTIKVINNAYQNHDPNHRLLVKYEKLKNDTVNELQKIYDFIGIKISDTELERIIERYDFKNIPKSQKGIGKFNRSAKIGGWKNNFNEEEKSIMNELMSENLKNMGYEI